MIIPKVSAAQFKPDETGLRRLLQRLRHWSLFGSIALTDIDDWSLDQIEFVTRMIGGRVDLEIELKQLIAEDALKLLNAGAETIICQSSDAVSCHGVPPDRLTRLLSTGEERFKPGDQIEVEAPEAWRLAQLNEIGVDCLVNSDFLDDHPEMISQFYSAILKSDRPDGLWPTVIIDSLGQVLGLAYSNEVSLLDAMTHRRGTYWSRSRDELWIKGKTSGAEQSLIGIRIDCDADCLRFQVEQRPPGFCHQNTYTCFGKERTIATVLRRLQERIESSDEKSFTKILVNDPRMLRTKLLEEAEELSDAESPDDIVWEAADVLYFSLVKLLGHDVGLDRVFQELARRMNRVVRRRNKLVE